MKLTLSLVFSLFFFNYLQAATLTVCASGCNHTTISAAVSAASSGDVLSIAAETFTESDILIDKNLTLRGSGQNTTIVQAHASPTTANDGVFVVDGAIKVVFKNMTIRHGNAVSGGINLSEDGGGVLILTSAGTDVAFQRVTLTENRAEENGGGVMITGIDGIVSFTKCVISHNEANITNDLSIGGGVRNKGASMLTFNKCTIAENSSGRHGGGINSGQDDAHTQLINCTIYGNTAGFAANTQSVFGGGVFLVGINISGTTSASIINCTIVNNHIEGSSSSLRGGGLYSGGSNAISLTNAIVANNTGAIDGLDFRDNASVNATFVSTLIEDCNSCANVGTLLSQNDPNLAAVAFCGNQAYFTPQSPSDALDNGTPPSGDIPTSDICGGNIRVAPHDLGSVDIDAVPLPILTSIPTLSQWSLIVLALGFMIFGTVYLIQNVFSLESKL